MISPIIESFKKRFHKTIPNRKANKINKAGLFQLRYMGLVNLEERFKFKMAKR